MGLPRITRRGTLKTTAALVGGSFAMARTGAVVGQPATPVSTPADEGIELLFVQIYAASTLSPSSDDGVLAMVLEGATGETIYFADRPDRQVGTIATGTFIDIFRRGLPATRPTRCWWPETERPKKRRTSWNSSTCSMT
ncbi:MAG: hypothetical protein H0T93_14250, partial [Chloroflexia bacterium]|nr:hypothetical protein [Chloroflexia bacterium]